MMMISKKKRWFLVGFLFGPFPSGISPLRNHLNHLFYLNARLTSQYNIQPKISYPANSFCKLNLPYNNIILWECITLKKWFYSIALTLHCIEIHILLCGDSQLINDVPLLLWQVGPSQSSFECCQTEP